MGPRSTVSVMAVIFPALLCGCANVALDAPTQNETQQAQVISRVQPTVRRVADADKVMLWKASRDYMELAFKPLGIVDTETQVLETNLLEWDHEMQPHRTVITVQLAEDPQFPRHTQLRCVAQKIEAHIAFEEAVTGEPIPRVWVVLGNDQDIEKIVTDQIMRRYLLLREGRDPDSVPIMDPPTGLRRRNDGLPTDLRTASER